MPPADIEAGRARAPVIVGLGAHHHPITTATPRAQRFFDQGLMLAWAFDSREALRSFGEAARLDPACAMCEWGIAYALGPNLNDPFAPRAAAARHAARARALAEGATDRERRYIDALAARYGLAPGKGSAAAAAAEFCDGGQPPGCEAVEQALDRAYAAAMGAVARAYADDRDAAVLHAEALMMLAPWDWWSRAGEPRPGTLEAVRVLERVLARHRRHPAANHFYVHLLEAAPRPERALGAALRLENLAPAASHLVHMPAHLFMRVGRYHDAVRVNQAAIEADRRLAARIRDQGFEPGPHGAHHHHYLWAAAAMAGRSGVALAAAGHLGAIAASPDAPFGHLGDNDYYRALPLLAQVRFQRWEEIRAAPKPDESSGYATGIWHFAQGLALAHAGDTAAATRNLNALDGIRSNPVLETQSLKGIDTLAAFLAIARATLVAEIELGQQNPDAAIDRFEEAVRLEGELEDEEPPPWLGPARHALGRALLAAGRAFQAERVFRDDLRRNPDNGWALYGLARSLRLQAKHAEAARTEAAARVAWQHADVPPPY